MNTAPSTGPLSNLPTGQSKPVNRISSIRTRLILAFLAVTILPFVGIVLVLAITGAQSSEQQVFDQLGIISTFKRNTILNWHDTLLTDFGNLLVGDVSSQEIRAVDQGETEVTDAMRQVFLRRLVESRSFSELMILDPKGIVNLSTDRDQEGQELGAGSPSVQQYLDFTSNTPTITPPIYDGLSGRVLSYVLYPILDDQGAISGLLAGRLNLKALEDILNERTGLDASGRSFLVGKDSLLLAGLNQAEQGAPISNAAVVLGVQNQDSGTLTYRSYDGTQVIGAYRWLPALQSVLVIEQSRSEATRSTLANLAVNASVTLSSILVALFVALMVTHTIASPVAELADTAIRLARGEREVRAEVENEDEIGLLASAFNQMTGELQNLIEGLEERVEERTQLLEQRSGFLEASAQVSKAASSILNIDELERSAVDLIAERFDLYYVGLFLRQTELSGEAALIDRPAGSTDEQETREWAILRAGTGDAGRKMLERRHRLPVGSASMIGWSIANSQPRIAQEASLDTVRAANPDLPATRSEAAIPMRSRGRVIGALSVQSAQSNAFDEISIAALQSLADQLGVAIDNAMLFARSQEALQAERRAYATQSQSAWADLLRARSEFSLYMGETRLDLPETKQAGEAFAGETALKVTAPVWRPEMELAARKGQIVQLNRPGGVVPENGKLQAGVENEQVASLAVPLIVRGSVIAVLNIRRSTQASTTGFSADERAFVTNISEQLSTALESARLYADTRQRAEQERLVSEVSGKMRASLDVDQVLETAIEELYRTLQLESLTISLREVEQ